MLIAYFLVGFFIRTFPKTDFPWVTKTITWLTYIVCAIVILFPPSVFTYVIYGFYATLITTCINLIRIMYVSLKEKRAGAPVFFFGTISFLICAIHDALLISTVITGIELFSLGAFCFILSQAYMLSSLFSKSFAHSKKLGEDLKDLNKSLEEKVEERTQELATSNDGLLAFNEILSKTNNKMTASINYAKRIQNALLVNWQRVKEDFPNSFVLFKPKDIVSGDFYWYKQGENKTIFAMLDCTGHGVPGAFMSIIGNEILNKVTSDYTEEEWNAGKILDSTDLNLRNILSYNQSKVQDGMDMALCIIDSDKSTLEYAGAKVPLLYFQNGVSKLIKGNKKSVGGKIYTEEKYVSHKIDVSIPTYFYLYSDGYQDQFGGHDNRKFMSLKFRELLSEIHQSPSPNQQVILEMELNEWQGNTPQVDDILVMGVGIDFR
jgi:serine phosphatase RsbU (regulator of sigma subunit)